MVIKGRVQGVFYRASSKKMADQLGLAGWVRNLPDEGVEAVLEGEEDKITKMIDWCQQGPPLAEVDRLTSYQEKEKGLKEFKIKY